MVSPTLTVLMPNYNHGAFIAEALESVARQSVPPDRILVIDDGSTDDSLSVLERLQAQIPYLEVIANERNRGAVATINDLFSRAETEYVYGMAADDKLLPGFFEATLELLRRHPEAGMCVTLSRLIDREGRDLGVYPTPVVRSSPCLLTPAEVRELLLLEGWFAQGNATVYRREALRSAGPFREELGSFCDGFASRVVALTYGACYVPRALVAWRRLEDGYSASEAADVQRSRVMRARAVELMATEYSALFPEAYINRFDKQMQLDHELRRARALQQERQAQLASSRAPSRALGALLAHAAPIENGVRELRLRRRLGLPVVGPFRGYARRRFRGA